MKNANYGRIRYYIKYKRKRRTLCAGQLFPVQYNVISDEAKELLETVSKISGRIQQLAAVTEEISTSTDQILNSTESVKNDLNRLVE